MVESNSYRKDSGKLEILFYNKPIKVVVWVSEAVGTKFHPMDETKKFTQTEPGASIR